VNCAAIQQRDFRRSVDCASEPQQRRLKHIRASAGDFQDVSPRFPGHTGERPLQQTGVQPHPAESAIGEANAMQRSVDLLRRAQVTVEPLFLNNSFHAHPAMQGCDNLMT
jgi:hypothetical protein